MTVHTGPQRTRAVIFDLDGTLVQTRVASWEIFARISERFGLGITRPEQYYDLFRGNVFTSIETLCRDGTEAAEVKRAFLDLLRSEYTPPMVPGLVEVVRRLAAECTLAVLSSNAMQVLRRVLVANDLAFCFAHVFGGDVAPDKRAAIQAFLADAGSAFRRRCAADYDEAGARAVPEPASTVLVTDTAGDVRDALAAGIRVVGVAWGMHSVDELTAAGAEFVALWPQELSAHLLGEAAATPPSGACAIPARAVTAGGCGCGCDGSATVGTARRERRRAAARALAAPAVGTAAGPAVGTAVGTADAELLAAVRRVCGRG
ncbi:HAD family hydrolase [Actinophytocola sp.]|jgi:phosphoglycolate phosphatase|uniref:HAD family hydrolase n=1 Tax=Actinophytocola sp. TaxID=1872138 RepID=UPI002EDB27BF